MTDDLDRQLSASLKGAAGAGFDADAAAAAFSERRSARVRARRTAGAVGLGLAVALGALAPAIGRDLFSSDGGSNAGLTSAPSLTTSPAPAPSDEVAFTAIASAKPTSATWEPSAVAPSEQATAPTPTPSPPKEVDDSATPDAPAPSDDAGPPPYARVDDSGKTYTIGKGEGLVVLLDGDESFPWSELVVGDKSVLYGESGQAGGGDQEWKFIGMKAGRTTVSSTQDPACRESNPPCGAPSRYWEITVVVTA